MIGKKFTYSEELRVLAPQLYNNVFTIVDEVNTDGLVFYSLEGHPYKEVMLRDRFERYLREGKLSEVNYE